MELGPEISAMENDLHSISCHRLACVLVGSDEAACVWMCLDRNNLSCMGKGRGRNY